MRTSNPNRRYANGRSLCPSQWEQRFYGAVFGRLRDEPALLAVLRDNHAHFQSQQFLRRQHLRALEEMGWLLQLHSSVDEIEQAVLAESRSGQRLRRFPLLFRDILSQEETLKYSRFRKHRSV